jgi:hypothetical protein
VGHLAARGVIAKEVGHFGPAKTEEAAVRRYGMSVSHHRTRSVRVSKASRALPRKQRLGSCQERQGE